MIFMTNKQITERLFELQDKKFASFHSVLIPNVPSECVIGVKVPKLRKMAAELYRAGDYAEFLKQLPHKYYEENMLHGLLVSEIRDFDTCVRELEWFLPYVDNWAVCDSMSPQTFKKNKEKLLVKIREWTASCDTYTCRFGLGMLMKHFLDDDFKEEYLVIPTSVTSEEYYLKMMVAWFFATALAKQWEATIPYIEGNKLDSWTHNKAIQKARESFRISEEQKNLLNAMKR